MKFGKNVIKCCFSVGISVVLMTSLVFAGSNEPLDFSNTSSENRMEVTMTDNSKLRSVTGQHLMSLTVDRLDANTFIQSSSSKTVNFTSSTSYNVQCTSYTSGDAADVGFIYYDMGQAYVNGFPAKFNSNSGTFGWGVGSTDDGWSYAHLSRGYVRNTGSERLKASFSIYQK